MRACGKCNEAETETLFCAPCLAYLKKLPEVRFFKGGMGRKQLSLERKEKLKKKGGVLNE